MDEDGILPEIEELRAELFRANYGVQYYSGISHNLGVQIHQLSDIALEPQLHNLSQYLAQNLFRSRAQLLQDLIVGYLFRNKAIGFFCEFGAADGKSLSNTYFLEKDLQWHGILAEPSRRWHDLLFANRNCKISLSCVYHTSNLEIIFNEVDDGMLSTIDEYSSFDLHGDNRKNGLLYSLPTITLKDLLIENSAPSYIDFLSVDTEGSEWAILEKFDFAAFTFGAIFVEHNFGENREKILNLLESNGYRRILVQYSKWDDWFISEELYSENHQLIETEMRGSGKCLKSR